MEIDPSPECSQVAGGARIKEVWQPYRAVEGVGWIERWTAGPGLAVGRGRRGDVLLA